MQWFLAHVAQLVEHTLGKGEVIGSTPIMGSMFVFSCFQCSVGRRPVALSLAT
jgi:hypothetical protein